MRPGRDRGENHTRATARGRDRRTGGPRRRTYLRRGGGIARPRRRPRRRRAGRPVPCSGRAVGRRIDILSPISIRHALRGQRDARGQTASIVRYEADRGARERITVFESPLFLPIPTLVLILQERG